MSDESKMALDRPVPDKTLEELTPEQLTLIRKPKKTRTLKDILAIQAIYGKSKDSLIARSVELRRQIQKTNFGRKAREDSPAVKEGKCRRICWKDDWIIGPENIQNLSDSDFEWVDSNDNYWKMHREIEQESVLAVDVEANEWSTYSGIICLIQISTYHKNYVIDTLAIPQEIASNLRKILENESILKIMHGSEYDLRWLQRDFQISVHPLLDTQKLRIYTSITGPDCPVPVQVNIGFAEMVSQILGFSISQEEKVLGQLSDYTMRPLNPKLMLYAANDSRLLMQCFYREKTNPEIKTAVLASKELLIQAVWKGKTYPSYETEVNPQASFKEKRSFKSLHEYRDLKAKKEDRKPQEIIPTKVLSIIAAGKPRRKAICFLPIEKELFAIAKNPSRFPEKKFKGQCWKCRDFGHLAVHCQNKKEAKAIAEKKYYTATPERQKMLEKEKDRIKIKRQLRRQAEAKARQFTSDTKDLDSPAPKRFKYSK